MSDQNANLDVMGAWMERVNRALANADGVTAEFHTSFQSHDAETAPYFAHAGQQVAVARLIIDADMTFDGRDFYEESLPFFVGRFADGQELLCGFEETFSQDERFIELMDSVNAGYYLARNMDYSSPQDLAEFGTDEDKSKFVKEVQALKLGHAQNFNTPDEFREQQALRP